MSIGVIRKWKPQDIDPRKYPGVRRLASSFAGEINPSKLRVTQSPQERQRNWSAHNPKVNGDSRKWLPFEPKCDKCKGEGCFDCEPDKWGALRPDTGGEPEPLGVTNLNLSEPMDLAFRLLKIEPGLEGAARNIAYGDDTPNIPIEEPEDEEPESEMDRLDRELQLAEEALTRSRKIHAEMGENWNENPKGKNVSRGNVEERARHMEGSNVELGY
jgi:hypothetical protein|tara:strand:- start:4788 stop:5432 length:645 start_codon:yes stop_codon:yes gene_type:complete